jgi:site-specific DNA-methyltransferase (adenine-specific)
MSDSFFSRMLDRVTCGDCIDVMANMPARSVDFVLTDPPYLGIFAQRREKEHSRRLCQ